MTLVRMCLSTLRGGTDPKEKKRHLSTDHFPVRSLKSARCFILSRGLRHAGTRKMHTKQPCSLHSRMRPSTLCVFVVFCYFSPGENENKGHFVGPNKKGLWMPIWQKIAPHLFGLLFKKTSRYPRLSKRRLEFTKRSMKIGKLPCRTAPLATASRISFLAK